MTLSPRVEWTYETLHDSIRAIEEPSSYGARETLWIITRHLGVAKGQDGPLEVFIVGPRLIPRTNAVRRHMEFGIWATSTGEELEANRIVFPRDAHFVSLVSLIVLELLRFGLGGERSDQDAFHEVEPLVELALLRGALPESSVIGLLGELVVLEHLLADAQPDPVRRSEILDLWRGYLRGERDFRIGPVGIEVKTTQDLSSAHTITGIWQVELGEGEKDLFLLSIGIAPTGSGGESLPNVVARILVLLGDEPDTAYLTEVQERFLRRVASYGVGSSVGYDHKTMASWTAYQTEFRFTFVPRLYSLLDSDVRLIRSVDLTDSMIVPSSVAYRIDLPDVVNPGNPETPWDAKLQSLLVKCFEQGLQA